VEREALRVATAQNMLQVLEKREQALVDRLKHTQVNEGKARQMLIDAIMATSQGHAGVRGSSPGRDSEEPTQSRQGQIGSLAQ